MHHPMYWCMDMGSKVYKYGVKESLVLITRTYLNIHARKQQVWRHNHRPFHCRKCMDVGTKDRWVSQLLRLS